MIKRLKTSAPPDKPAIWYSDSKAACPIPIPPGAIGMAIDIKPIGIIKNCVANPISLIPINFVNWKKIIAIKECIQTEINKVINKVIF